MNGIPIQFLNGAPAENAYNQQLNMAGKTRSRRFQKWTMETPDKIRRRQAAVQYYTRGLDNKTVRNIGYLTKGLDFVGYQGNGSIEDSEMIYNHLLRTKQVVDAAPQAVAVYQNPQQLSDMLGYVIDNWDSANREQAIDNMAREESRLIDEGKIRLANDESDAHFLEPGENYDPDTQRVLKNGAVETLPNKRGLFNRLKKTTTFANVASKDADLVNDNTFTRKLKATIRQNVGANRKPTTKNLRQTKIKNGYVRTKTIRVPIVTISIASLQGLNGLSGIDDDLQFLMYGVDFAYNADEGLTVQDNIDNCRRYFARLSGAIAAQPLAFYDTEAEANAVRQMIAQLIPVIGNDAAMNALVSKYETLNGFDGLGELNGKLKNAIKKATKAVAKATTKAATNVASSVKNVAESTANATKQVAKTTANVTKTAAKTTANMVKSGAQATASAAKNVAKTTTNAAKIAANTTASAAKTVAKTTADAAKIAAKTTASAAKTVAKTTANAAQTGIKAAVSTGKAAVQSTVNATKAAANVVKAGVQVAAGNKAAAKESLQKAVSQAKSAVTQPIKTTVNVTKEAVKKTVVEPTKEIAKTTATAVKDTVKNTIVEPTKEIAKTTATAVKDTVKKTIVEPTKSVVKTTTQVMSDAYKNTVSEPIKTVVKETKDLAKNAVYEPAKTIIKETVVKPTVTAWKLTKKVTKVALKLTKKVLTAVWAYNPLTLLIKGGLLIAFRLNMFRMASRSYLGSMTEEEAISQYGITPEEYEAQKKSYDFIRNMFCKIFLGKEEKLLAALKKGASKKWKGTDNPTSKGEIEALCKDINADDEIIEELNADIAEDKAELEAKGIVASDEASAEKGAEYKEELEITESNQRTTKEATTMYEGGSDQSNKVAELPKGTALYVDIDNKNATDGTWIAASTTDGKNSGYVKISSLAEIFIPDGQPVAVVSGLCDNGYDSIQGLGEVATAAAATTAASGSIFTICANIGGFFKNVTSAAKDIADAVNTYNDLKEAVSSGDSQQPQQTEQAQPQQQPQQDYIDSRPIINNGQQNLSPSEQTQMQTAKPKQQQKSQQGGISKKTFIIGGATVVGLGLLAFVFRSRNNNQSNNQNI